MTTSSSSSYAFTQILLSKISKSTFISSLECLTAKSVAPQPAAWAISLSITFACQRQAGRMYFVNSTAVDSFASAMSFNFVSLEYFWCIINSAIRMSTSIKPSSRLWMFWSPSLAKRVLLLQNKIKLQTTLKWDKMISYFVSLQCAAVKTNLSLINDPVQKNSNSSSFLYPKATMWGKAPGSVTVPPAMP